MVRRAGSPIQPFPSLTLTPPLPPACLLEIHLPARVASTCWSSSWERKKEREREIEVDKKMILSLLPSQTVNEFLIQSEILEMPSSTDTSKFFFGSKVSFLRISEAWCCCDDDDDYESSDGSCWLFKLAQSAQAFSCPEAIRSRPSVLFVYMIIIHVIWTHVVQ